MAVGLAPPPELVAAQRATLEIVRELEHEVRPGMTERQLAARAEELARERGATGVWTPIAVGAGPGALVCHPDFPPTDRSVDDPDLVWFDVTPDFGGWPGDVTRSVVVGNDAGRARACGRAADPAGDPRRVPAGHARERAVRDRARTHRRRRL